MAAAQVGAFRTCKVTGLKVHLPAEKLIIWNAVVAVLMLALGGALALLIALTRWQAVHLLPPELFYRFLSAHGVTMLVFWIVFFEVAGLYFGSCVLLNARLVKPGLGWLAFVLMVIGAVLAEITLLWGKATVMFTAYPPLEAHPLFYLGIIIFSVGAMVAVGLFFGSVVMARVERRITSSVPLVTFGLITAAIIAVMTLVAGAMAFIPLFLKSVGIWQSVDPAAYRLIFWAFGHPAQQINLAAMVAVWYALASLTTGAKPVNEKLCRSAFVLYILFINLGSIHHLLVDPGLSMANRIFNTSYFMYLAVIGSMIHAFSIPAGIEVAQRAKGYTRGLFQWLVRAPWGEPGFSAMVLSMVLFGFFGGVTGVIQGTMQINLLVHNTMRIPGHFHWTVVGGTTLAFMGLAYYLVPLMTQRQLVGRGWAKLQPYIYGVGVFLLASGMWLSGVLGVPRRTWDVTYSASPIGVPVYDGLAQTFLTLLGIGAILAVIGGVIFVVLMVLTVFAGKRF